ncbi:MAG: ATP-binding protein, partial [Deltaproteobacteria bacterium]|jgi:hypothetical protein|nr:ATP-binding protein [Deltaproteobacteria bacterium]
MLVHKNYNCCFLSRPRRFGKTLFLKTIDSLFQGDRKLFEGLWIGKSDYRFEKHPVLNFNMAYDDVSASDDLVIRIKRSLIKQADKAGVRLTSDCSIGEMFEDLLEGIHEKRGGGAVVLVDEYDAPVTDHISDKELALANRKILHDFYRSMKNNIDYIHFAFVTGITRFAMTSLDSGPNNFKDISLSPEFSGICGFTPSELDSCFQDRFEETLDILKDKCELPQSADIDDLKVEILKWYDGYNWLGNEHVLNPYSILNFFDEKEFDSFWPSTGRPSHLSALIRENPLEYLQPCLDSYPVKQIKKAELSDITVVPVLFHSGYLTIDSKTTRTRFINNQEIKEKALTFKTPNMEVASYSNADMLMDIFKPSHKYISEMSKNLTTALLNMNSVEVVRMLHNLLVSLSFHQHPTKSQNTQEQQPASEKFYHAILHASLLSAGFNVISEASGGEGRSDITLFINEQTCNVIELKYCASSIPVSDIAEKINAEKQRTEDRSEKELAAALDSAEDQMKRKDYAGPYRATRHKVICLALAIRDRTEVAARFVDA